MFCAGDILTVDYCMEVYTQLLNNEPFDFFIAATREILGHIRWDWQRIIYIPTTFRAII